MFILNQNKLLLNKPTINLENKLQKTKRNGKKETKRKKIVYIYNKKKILIPFVFHCKRTSPPKQGNGQG